MTPSDPTYDLGELEALAAAATPGPWETQLAMSFSSAEVNRTDDGRHVADVAANTDARFIAAADPPTVAVLCAELRRYLEALGRISFPNCYYTDPCGTCPSCVACAALAASRSLIHLSPEGDPG